jgi:hypothetical protein
MHRGEQVISVTRICSRMRDWPAYVKIDAADHTQFQHHQASNASTAGAQAFTHYTLEERAITHHAGPVRVGGC